ncbi:hypothetical protein [Streptosporangium carneum]|uniref:Abortive infection protein n=1 Tax=Streptosporangium carneum TaxID=47481 RepID=A0A9W6IAG4_9ACTN|nr:hypothetical protein [Streptosporangium carneum]GLK14138.1 hypothetical protein GCM10017600_75500 [Streptosporangium carneum]
MTAAPIGRRTLLAGAAALAAATPVSLDVPRASAQGDPGPAGRTSPLRHRGVNYDTEREVWRSDFVRRDMRAVRRDLHCNAVILLGSDLGRLTEAASAAADEGLYVWFEARQFDRDAGQTLRFLTSVARAAERLRRRHPRVGISVGCELTLFMSGLVPGRDWRERAGNIGGPGSTDYNQRLNAFLGQAVGAVRPIFKGWLTYSSGVWEQVAWRDFDAVGVDLYRDRTNEATYAQSVRALRRHGKPVIITEFGCCTFRGADKAGGEGFDIVDWTADPPVVRAGHVRDERVQARYVDELLDVYEAEDVYGAFVYTFVDRDAPYSPDPRHDLDMAGFTLVKVRPSDVATGRWEPKLVFHTVARRFG